MQENVSYFRFSMNFLFPNLLYFLIALGIPVVIHLFNFRRYKRVEFTNVRLLKDLETKSRSTKNLKNLLILFMRLFALTFLILAFAQPFLGGDRLQEGRNARNTLVYVDNSFSMSEGSGENTLINNARLAALEIVRTSEGSPYFYLLTNDFKSGDLLRMNKDEVSEALEKIEISSQSRSWQAIQDRVESIKEENNLDQMTSYILSDFQLSQFPDLSVGMDTSIELKFVQLKVNESTNISIDSCFFDKAMHSINVTDSLYVRLHNYSADAVKDHPLRLFSNDQQRALVSVDLDPWESKEISIPVEVADFGLYACRLETVDEGIEQDDVLYFSYQIDSSIGIYHLGPEEINRYFSGVFQEPFVYRHDETDQADIGFLSESSTYILCASAEVSEGLISELTEGVRQGNALVIYTHADVEHSDLNQILSSLNLEQIRSSDTGRFDIGELNISSSLLRESIEKMPQNPNLPVVRNRYNLSERNNVVKEDILLFADGKSALRKYKLGRGFIYLYLFQLNDDGSNFTRHSLFVPISLNMAFSSVSDKELYYNLNRDELIPVSVNPSQESGLHVTKDHIDVIPEIRRLSKNTYIQLHQQIEESGNFYIREKDQVKGILSLNYDRKESDIRRYDLNEVEFTASNIEVISGENQKITAEIASLNRPTMLWKYCIILALMFFIAELLIIKFMKT